MAQSRIAAAAAALVLLLTGAAVADVTPSRPSYPPAKSSYPFRVKVRDFHGAEGFGFDCYLSADDIVLVYWDDFGSTPKEVFRHVLSPEERTQWTRFLARLPIESLKPSYVDPAVADGLHLTFDFQLAGRPAKRIVVANADQKELASLIDELNRVLPAKGKLGRPRAW